MSSRLPQHLAACLRVLTSVIVSSAIGFTPTIASAQVPGRVEGTVVSRTTGQPVPDAAVRVDGDDRATAVTNRVGRFVLTTSMSGRVGLRVEAPGFLPAAMTDVPVGASELVRIELDVTPNFMERVQVTATKEAETIGNIAAGADVVDRSSIDRRGDQTLTQAIANVPGVLVSGQAGSFESVMLRGMPREGNEFTNTLLLVDGVPQVDSRNSARMIALPINDASSIEVVRGPNSALYGRTAIGGSVNVRTADPTPVPQLNAEFTGGELETLKGSAAVSGPLGKWGGYYVSGMKEHNGGYYESLTDFAIDKAALFGKLTFVPDTRSFGSISANRAVSDDSLPTNVPIVDGTFLSDIDPQFDRLASLNLPGPNYHQGETRVTLNYTRQLSPWARAVEVFGYRRIQYKFLPDGDVIGSPFDLDAHTFTMYPFRQTTNEDIYYQEARAELSPSIGRRTHSIIVGGSYEWNTGGSNGELLFTDPDTEGWPLDYHNPVFPPESEWQIDPYGSTYHVGIAALFGQYIVEPTPRWILSAGGRYDRLALDNQAIGGSQVDATFSAFSPKASATYRLLPGTAGRPSVNIYGSYSQAFLPPRRPSQLTPTSVPTHLEPEDIDNYEAGVKATMAGGQVAFEATYFDMRRNGIVTTVRQGPFFIPTNAGEEKFRGVETGISWGGARGSVYANASFYRSRFGEYVIESSGGDTVLTGNRLPIAPKAIVNGGFIFRPHPLVETSVNVKYVGDTALDQLNTFLLDPYTLVDAAVTWKRGPLRITLSAHNLFDQEYYWSGDASLAETADPGRPRQVLVTTSFVLK